MKQQKQQAKDDQKAREVVAEALRRPRYEVSPLKDAEGQIIEHVPTKIKITVTA